MIGARIIHELGARNQVKNSVTANLETVIIVCYPPINIGNQELLTYNDLHLKM